MFRNIFFAVHVGRLTDGVASPPGWTIYHNTKYGNTAGVFRGKIDQDRFGAVDAFVVVEQAPLSRHYVHFRLDFAETGLCLWCYGDVTLPEDPSNNLVKKNMVVGYRRLFRSATT